MENSDNDHHKPTADRLARQPAGDPLAKGCRKPTSRPSVEDAGGAEKNLSTQPDHLPDLIYTLNANGEIMALNQAVNAYGYHVEELLGTSFFNLLYMEDRQWVRSEYEQVLKKKKDQIRSQQFRMVDKTGDVCWIEANCIFRFTEEGHFIVHEGVCRDISESIQNRNIMLKAQLELEEQVRIRTAELVLSNEELQKEIYDRRNTERRLRDREADLEMEKANLQETNTALKVLLKRREVDKHEFEEQVLYNIKELILPYLDKLKMVVCDERQEAYLTILESNLSDITGSFTRRLSLDAYGLTNSELKVANFIRQGKRTREIASLLGISRRTVEAYRLGIRRKMRIQGRKINLRTFLMSIN
jgi:PAS domain S-box-containing protein